MINRTVRSAYDGAADPDIFGPSNATWWTRFFDYL
jgi:hypothetical protein